MDETTDEMPDWVAAVGIAASTLAFGLWLWWRLAWQAGLKDRQAMTEIEMKAPVMTKGKATQFPAEDETKA